MCRQFPIILGTRQVGMMDVSQQGLYKQFSCRCTFPKDGAYIITVRCGEYSKSLGTCIRKDNAFGLKTKIPSKYFRQDEMEFIAQERKADQGNELYLLIEEIPIPCLDNLDFAYFCLVDGRPALKISPDRHCQDTECSVGP